MSPVCFVPMKISSSSREIQCCGVGLVVTSINVLHLFMDKQIDIRWPITIYLWLYCCYLYQGGWFCWFVYIYMYLLLWWHKMLWINFRDIFVRGWRCDKKQLITFWGGLCVSLLACRHSLVSCVMCWYSCGYMQQICPFCGYFAKNIGMISALLFHRCIFSVVFWQMDESPKETASSSEFDAFLATREKEANSAPSDSSAASNRGGRTLQTAEEEQALFSL